MISKELTRILQTKEDLRAVIGLETDVPFHQYPEYIKWSDEDINLQFTLNKYSQDKKPIGLIDAAEFTRDSEIVFEIDDVELTRILQTKEDLRAVIGLETDVPFHQYPEYIKWSDEEIPEDINLQFTLNKYSQDKKPIGLIDAAEFTRDSEIVFEKDGVEVTLGKNIPRIDSRGLLLGDTEILYVHPADKLTGDWDEGISYEMIDDQAIFTGHGYIRSIKMIKKTWNPRVLFMSGESGAWYDPSDLSTLFQDASGTTPVTTTGDPVGLILDKSGNGLHAAQPVSAARPTYATDGALHWIESDGVDDNLFTALIPALHGAGNGLYASLASQKLSNRPVIFSQYATSGGARYFSTDQTNNTSKYQGGVQAGSYFRNDQTAIVDCPDVAHIASFKWRGGTTRNAGRLNGGEWIESKSSAQINYGGDAAIELFSIAAAGYFRKGKIFQAVVCNRVLEAEEEAKLLEWMAKKAGVEL